MYRQKAQLNAEALWEPLSRIIDWEPDEIELGFESSGHSGAVFRVVVSGRSGWSRHLVLKRDPDPNAWRIYRDILRPCELNSPEMLGVCEIADSQWLVMEYVPHEQPDWADPQRYQRAVDWLLHKDAVANRNLAWLGELEYLEPFEAGDPGRRIEAIARSCNVQLDPSLTNMWRELLERRFNKAEEITPLLRQGPQTITHNDYQMFNILFGESPKQEEMFVIDWTYPAIGSVCVDLASLVHVAPRELRSLLVDRYRRAAPFEPFEPIFDAARAHVNLSVLTWMIEAIAEGQSHAVHQSKLREIVSELQEYFGA